MGNLPSRPMLLVPAAASLGIGVLSGLASMSHPSSAPAFREMYKGFWHAMRVIAQLCGWVIGIRRSTQHGVTLPQWLWTAAAPWLKVLWRAVVFGLGLIRQLFAPHTMLRQMTAVVIIQGLTAGVHRIKHEVKRRMAFPWASTWRRRAKLEEQLATVKTYQEWRHVAKQLDTVTGKDAWRREDESPYYDAQRLRQKVELYRHLMATSDIPALMWHLRAELLRKISGLGNMELFDEAASGTKHLAENYIETVAECLDFVADCGREQGGGESMEDLRQKLAFFMETRHSYGRSALLFSGGATLGLYHVGVTKALLDRRLLPRIISGASAGSISAGILGCKTDAEILDLIENNKLNLTFFGPSTGEESVADILKDDLPAGRSVSPGRGLGDSGETKEESKEDDTTSDDERSRRRDAAGSPTRSFLAKALLLLPPPFAEAFSTLFRVVPKFLRNRPLLDINVLGRCLRANMGDLTFLEAYEKTGRVINITVSPSANEEFPRLLNYLTAPNVLVWSAALASCAIPGIFASVEIIAKDRDGRFVTYFPAGARWSDGSVNMDLPMDRLSELFNVNQSIVSQVNPHAHLFTGLNVGYGALGQILRFLKREIKSFLVNASDLGIFRRLSRFSSNGFNLLPFVTQPYEGDITICPQLRWRDITNLLKNPDAERFQQCFLDGQRAAWKLVPMLRAHCLIEFTLDDCVHRLRHRIAAVQRNTGSAAPIARLPSFLHPVSSVRSLEEYSGEAADLRAGGKLYDHAGPTSIHGRGSQPSNPSHHSHGSEEASHLSPLHTPFVSDSATEGAGQGRPGEGGAGGFGRRSESMMHGSSARLDILLERMKEGTPYEGSPGQYIPFPATSAAEEAALPTPPSSFPVQRHVFDIPANRDIQGQVGADLADADVTGGTPPPPSAVEAMKPLGPTKAAGTATTAARNPPSLAPMPGAPTTPLVDFASPPQSSDGEDQRALATAKEGSGATRPGAATAISVDTKRRMDREGPAIAGDSTQEQSPMYLSSLSSLSSLTSLQTPSAIATATTATAAANAGSAVDVSTASPASRRFNPSSLPHSLINATKAVAAPPPALPRRAPPPRNDSKDQAWYKYASLSGHMEH